MKTAGDGARSTLGATVFSRSVSCGIGHAPRVRGYLLGAGGRIVAEMIELNDGKRWRLGCVSYLNAKPMVWGLDQAPAIEMKYGVPAGLLGLLQADGCDVALLPAIDYQRDRDLVMVPASCIGADGPVQTVRLFSRVPVNQVTRLYADVESHTSVALCRVVLRGVYGIDPEFVQDQSADVQARLLIGDKVVCQVPVGHSYQLDLADEWKRWTGLPFVFAVWMAKRGTRLGELPQMLMRAMEQGLLHVDEIVAADAVPRGWPAAVAQEYLTRLLKYSLDLSDNSPQRRALDRFYRLAFELGVTKQCRPIEVYGDLG